MASKSYENLVYIVTVESFNEDETAVAAFASWMDAETFIDLKVNEEKELNGCFECTRSSGFADCYLREDNLDDRITYRVRKPL